MNAAMKRMLTGKYPADENTFLKDMIHHHEIAVNMATIIINQTDNQSVMSLARDIIWAQRTEIAQMKAALCARSNHSYSLTSTPAPANYYGKPIRNSEFRAAMKNMMTGDYPRCDKKFLQEMIIHHQIAVEMAHFLNNYSMNPDLLTLARNIIWSQTFEIWFMQRILESLSPSPYTVRTLTPEEN